MIAFIILMVVLALIVFWIWGSISESVERAIKNDLYYVDTIHLTWWKRKIFRSMQFRVVEQKPSVFEVQGKALGSWWVALPHGKYGRSYSRIGEASVLAEQLLALIDHSLKHSTVGHVHVVHVRSPKKDQPSAEQTPS